MGRQPLDARPRQVLFLNWRDTRNPEGGGSEVYVERIAAELAGRGYRATIVCASHADAPRDEVTGAGVRIVRRGGRRTVYLRAALLYLAGWLGFGALSRRQLGRPEVIVDVCNGIPFFSPLYNRRRVIALVHHVHREQWPVVMPKPLALVGWWLESRLAPRVYRRCGYVTVSSASRLELSGIGVDPSRIAVIHNGTPESPWAPVEPSATPLLVVLSRLVPHKQVEVALRTVAALADEVPDLRLVVAGKGWWEPRLRDLAARLAISDRVRFAGYIPEEEKHALLCQAWLSLAPSLKEGWGLTIVEAGERGTPTVAFRRAGGVAEALVDGETGALADDEASFIEHVRTLLADHDRRGRMGAAAVAHAARFTWTAAGERFAALVGGFTPVPTLPSRRETGEVMSEATLVP
jgi:glycosyltransferase involved in cell wall biosynthesis